MTPDRLSVLMDKLQWSVPFVCCLLDVDERTVRRWLHGTRKIPDDVSAWLGMIEEHPPPSMRGRPGEKPG